MDGVPRQGWVTAVALAGREFQACAASGGGWTILGPERRVTRSCENVLYELDGKPALQLYKELPRRAGGCSACQRPAVPAGGASAGGRPAAVVGFHSYGEIAPADGKAAQLHNQTMTLTTIREAG